MYLLNNLLTQAQVYDLESPLFFYLFIYLFIWILIKMESLSFVS